MLRKVYQHFGWTSFLLLCMSMGFLWFLGAQGSLAASTTPYNNKTLETNASPSTTWRIRIHEAAVVTQNMVTLADIGEIFGTPPTATWNALANRPLWASPTEVGKPFIINRSRLYKALRQSLGDYADMCILPSQLAIQRGGVVMREAGLRSLIVKTLTPFLNVLEGQAELLEFRLPPYVFLEHDGQQISLEPVTIEPGRLSFGFLVKELDGTTLRRFTGTAMLHLWQDVPTPTTPMSRGDALNVSQITRVRQNLAFAKGEIWDGRGGPWQVRRSISPGQVILFSDLEPLAMIQRGDIIQLEYNQGAIRLKVQAEALASGGLGETILVRNLQSKKQIYGVVRSASVVEVQ